MIDRGQSNRLLLAAAFIQTFILLFNISNSLAAPDNRISQSYAPRRTLPPPPEPLVNYCFPVRSYEKMNLNGWKVYVEQPLIEVDPQLATQALARLEHKLNDAMDVLPVAAHKDFRRLDFYLMAGPQSVNGGRNSGLAYFRQNAPDYQKELDTRWRNCVVIYSAKNYVDLSELWSIKALVHELSHAHHLLHYPENKPDELYDSWENAMRRGLYHNVQDDQGHNLEKAWACTNQLEYFAELSCMYFVGCNYYPFNRQQLKSYDPDGYAVIEQMWQVRD